MKEKNSLSVFTSQEIYEIEFDDIRLIESSGMSCAIFTTNNKILTSKNLGAIEQLLNHKFYRVNNSTIVNRDYILKYIRIDGGSIILKCGTRIRPSRERRSAFIGWYTNGGGVNSRLLNSHSIQSIFNC